MRTTDSAHLAVIANAALLAKRYEPSRTAIHVAVRASVDTERRVHGRFQPVHAHVRAASDVSWSKARDSRRN
jgi:hypothetical protein